MKIQIHLLISPRRVPDVSEEIDQRLFLKWLWEEICRLPVRQRMALLLNLRDEQGGGVAALLPITGIATIRQIAKALEMADEDFAELWRELPLDDTRIAGLLGITRQQVINLRKCARERLARKMKAINEKNKFEISNMRSESPSSLAESFITEWAHVNSPRHLGWRRLIGSCLFAARSIDRMIMTLK